MFRAQAAQYWASHAVCGYAGLRDGVILVLLVRLLSKIPVGKVTGLHARWNYSVIFRFYDLYLKFTLGENFTIRSARLRFFFLLPRELI